MEYLDDVRDIRFNLFEWLPLDELLKTKRYGGYERDDLSMIIDEALKMAKGELAPTNEEGDRVGAQFIDNKVVVPECFRKAYKVVAENGWIGASADETYGGMGLPECVGTAVNEFVMGANTSLSLTLILGRGAGHLVEHFGSEEMQKLFCEKLYSGEWAGTMCLTEAGAGSDVGASKTKAEKIEGGKYKITGEKIFITSGDHDLTPNIVHLVLARTPGAPAGTKGLSLFIIPRNKVDAAGNVGEPNDVVVGNIEHKLGIHGSPTCTIVFGGDDGCEGYLLGEECQGMPIMFQMMNAARYEVGLQNLALASTSFQHALAYSRERLQGKHFKDRSSDGPQVPIIEHPDVRRMLLSQMSYVYAMRAILSFTAWTLDKIKVTEGDEQKYHQGVVEFMTPICKAWCTDWGFRSIDWGMQCYGGYGYTCDYPQEQYLRDARIALIYEGTNGIQALDLVFRKLRQDDGKIVKMMLSRVQKIVEDLVTDMDLGASAMLVGKALKVVGGLLEELGGKMDAPLILLPNCTLVLDMLGHVLGAGFLLEQAKLAKKALTKIIRENEIDASEKKEYHNFLKESAEAAFYHNKVQAAIHFAHRGVVNVFAEAVPLKTGESSAYDVSF